MSILRNLFCVLLPSLLFITGCTTSRSKSSSSGNGFSSSALLKQVNAIRSKGCNCGGRRYAAVPPVQWNSRLADAAALHSSYMQRTGRLTHTGRNGATPEKRVAAAGYRWSYVAENIAMGQQTTKEVIESWLQSPGHCRNIMSRSVAEIGAARSGKYWTLLLAAPN